MNDSNQINEPELLDVNVENDTDKVLNTDTKNSSHKGKNSKKIVIVIILLLLVVILIAVRIGFKDNNNETSNKQEVKEYKSQYRLSGNDLEDFDLSFLKLEDNNKNIVYSPLSIKYALAMLQDGAKGNSKQQISAVIGDYKPKRYSNNENMSFANALFIKNSYKENIKSSYQDNLLKKYNAEIIFDEFSDPSNINNWVSNKTFNLVNDLVDDVSSANFYLINALAIDMDWKKLIQATVENYKDRYSVSYKHEKYSDYIDLLTDDRYATMNFNNNSIKAKAVEFGASINNYDIVSDLGEDNIRQTITKEYTEWLAEGTCGGLEDNADVETYVNQFINELKSNYKKVEASTDYRFYVDDNVKLFSKELKEYAGTTLEYIGIMPTTGTLNEFIKNNDAKKISKLINNLKTVELENFEKGKVTRIKGGVPLFNYSYDLDLAKDLKKLGIKDIFELGKADISKITDDNSVVIDDVGHKANIEFSNEGIKAAAATTAGGFGAAGCYFEHLYDVPIVEIDMNFDKPYLYIIRDKDTKETWFVGAVYEPTVNTNPTSRVINEK